MILAESKHYLNPDNTTFTTTFVLPFILKNKTIITNYYGFINAFVEDINKPWLDNHIFILYKTSSIIPSLEKEFKQNKYYYDTQNIVIDNVFYTKFIFIIPKEYKILIKGLKDNKLTNILPSDKLKILKFWNCLDFKNIEKLLENINSFDNNSIKIPEIIPEEDSIDGFNSENSEYFFQKLGF